MSTWCRPLSERARAARASATRCWACSTAIRLRPQLGLGLLDLALGLEQPAAGGVEGGRGRLHHRIRGVEVPLGHEAALHEAIHPLALARRPAATALSAPTTSARMASVAARRASSRARASSTAASAERTVTTAVSRAARAWSIWAVVSSRAIGHLGAGRAEARLGRGHGGGRLVAPHLIVAGVDAQQEIALLHRLVVLDEQLDDVAGHLGADGGDGPLDVGVVGRDPGAGLVPVVARVDQTQHDHDARAAQHEATHHLVLTAP